MHKVQWVHFKVTQDSLEKVKNGHLCISNNHFQVTQDCLEEVQNGHLCHSHNHFQSSQGLQGVQNGHLCLNQSHFQSSQDLEEVQNGHLCLSHNHFQIIQDLEEVLTMPLIHHQNRREPSASVLMIVKGWVYSVTNAVVLKIQSLVDVEVSVYHGNYPWELNIIVIHNNWLKIRKKVSIKLKYLLAK